MAGEWTAEGVERWLAAYARAWRDSRAEHIARHWRAERFALYKAEELPRVMTGWDEVLAYWRANERLNEAVSLRFGEVTTHALGPALCAASARMRWDIRFAADARSADGSAFPHRGGAMGGENHVVMLLEGTPEAAALVAWVEAPDAALTYLRRLYLSAADPEALA